MKDLRWLLDTNVFIDARKRRPAVVAHFDGLRPGEAAQSVVTYGELLHGARRSGNESDARRRIAEIATLVPVLPLTLEVAERYGLVRAELSARGEIIGSNDLWIAAHALALELTLVTNSLREFRRVPDLKLANWAEPASKREA